MPTSTRRPSRWLAPLALVTCAIAIFAIVADGSGGGSSAGTPTTQRPAAGAGTGQKQTGSKKRRQRARSYRVQPGDTLSGISAKTGVPLARIEELNPSLDSQALQTGQKVKLGP